MTAMTYPGVTCAAFSSPGADWRVAADPRRARGSAVLPTEEGTFVSSFGPAVPNAVQLTNKSIVALPQLGSVDVDRFVTGDITAHFGSNTFRALSPPA